MVRPMFILLVLGMVALQFADGYYFKSAHTTSASARSNTRHLHHQRYHPSGQRHTHLERLLNRLEKLEATTSTTTTTTTTTPPPWKSQDSYEDDDDEEDFDDTEDDDFDDDDEDDDNLEDDDDDDTLQRQPQADDHTSSWDVPQNEPHYQPMSPISRMKWQTLGSRKGVEEARSQRLGHTSGYKVPQNDPEFRQAVDHMVRMSVEGECKVPKPKLVQVKSVYPNPSKIYLPPCTILHQCGEDTGCCKTETLTCVPRYTNRVDLYFYTTTVGSTAPQRVEKLTFYNHTECMCENRNAALMHRDVETGHYFRRSASYGPASVYRKQEPERSEPKSCRCPSKFSARYSRDGACSCDCFDKQRECLRLKKGKDYFSALDRQCIQTDECRLPSCEFGSYLRLAGRCRKKRERYEGWNP